MQTTTNYRLKKPENFDAFDKTNDNSNMDIIDAQMKTSADAIAAAVRLDGSKPMTGPLMLSGDPASDMEAATKKYVDLQMVLARTYAP